MLSPLYIPAFNSSIRLNGIWQDRSAHGLDVGVPVVLAAGHVVKAAPAQFRAGVRRVAVQGHFVDFVSVGQKAQRVVPFDVG